jgi:DNA polymerase III subunit epsilon
LLDFDFEPERPSWSKQLAVFDLETTGLDLKTSRIVSACIAVIDSNGEPTMTREWLVNPGIEIPEQAAAVHGISTQMAIEQGAAPDKSVLEMVELLLSLQKTMPLVAFNAPYDFSILHFEALRYNHEPLVPTNVIDPLVLDRKAVPRRFGKRTLGVLCPDYGISLVDAHNSTADAIAAGRLAQAMASKFKIFEISSQELHDAQVLWSDQQSLEFAEYMKLKQNRPDFQAVLGWPIKAI